MRSKYILIGKQMRFNLICLVLLTSHLVITLGLNSKFNLLLKENATRLPVVQSNNKKTR